MQIFTLITSRCLPIRTENIDTDQIIPARFLKVTTKEGIGKHLFANLRFHENGKEKQSVFNDPRYTGAKILIAGNNFGCGSSREHAPWALKDFGFDVVISSSFGDIFYNNSLKNGLLPVTLQPEELEELFAAVEHDAATNVTIDVAQQQVRVPSLSRVYTFPIDEFRKQCLLRGVDELGFLLSKGKEINRYERNSKSESRNSKQI